LTGDYVLYFHPFHGLRGVGELAPGQLFRNKGKPYLDQDTFGTLF
jgi:hypothetical protein